MEISVQYLEGGTHAADVSAQEARARLRQAFERVPFAMVLLGWDLAPQVVEACAKECALHKSALYLWQPVLTGHRRFELDPTWRVVALDKQPVRGYEDQPEFTFFCPNRPAVRDAVLENLSKAVDGGFYQGVFLDRVCFPSPAANIESQFGCFCEACQEAARKADLDLSVVRGDALRLIARREGREAAIRRMFSGTGRHVTQEPVPLRVAVRSWERMLAFRQRSIGSFVKEVADSAMAQGLKVGLDCFAPTLAPMVGQDLALLAGTCDWMKVMTYARAYGPASLPFEIAGLADWLARSEGESEAAALDYIAEAAGWPLPTTCEEIRGGGLPASVLTEELRRGWAAKAHPLLAGIEMVEIPGVAQLSAEQIRADSAAVIAGAPDGVVLSWDLLHMPLDRLQLANSLYGDRPPQAGSKASG